MRLGAWSVLGLVCTDVTICSSDGKCTDEDCLLPLQQDDELMSLELEEARRILRIPLHIMLVG